MIARLTVAELAAAVSKHPGTIRKALEAGKLHGTQKRKGGRWSIREDCAEAWTHGLPCAHQAERTQPSPARRKRRTPEVEVVNHGEPSDAAWERFATLAEAEQDLCAHVGGEAVAEERQ